MFQRRDLSLTMRILAVRSVSSSSLKGSVKAFRPNNSIVQKGHSIMSRIRFLFLVDHPPRQQVGFIYIVFHKTITQFQTTAQS